MKYAKYWAALPFVAAAAVAVPAIAPAAAQDGYTIGVSNTVQGNGWREEMICAIKAQALASGKVAKLNIAHRNTDAAGQLEDIRNLIGAGVNAIVVNPADPAGINAALKEATDKGHRRRRRRPGGDRAVGLRHFEQPGRIRLSRCEMALPAARRQGRRRLYARRRRRLGRQRSRQGLQAGARRVPGHQGRARSLHRLAAGSGQAADPRLHRHRHALQRHLDLGHRQRDRRRSGRIRHAAGAGRRRRQCRASSDSSAPSRA